LLLKGEDQTCSDKLGRFFLVANNAKGKCDHKKIPSKTKYKRRKIKLLKNMPLCCNLCSSIFTFSRIIT
jgi:hypothetical protein